MRFRSTGPPNPKGRSLAQGQPKPGDWSHTPSVARCSRGSLGNAGTRLESGVRGCASRSLWADIPGLPRAPGPGVLFLFSLTETVIKLLGQ